MGLADSLLQQPFGRAQAAFYELVSSPAVAEIVTPILRERATGRVLDVGCGGGAIAEALGAVGVEPSLPQAWRARRRGVAVALAPAERLPFPRATFDAVVSSCTIKHWREPAAGVRECYRVLGPGGRLTLVEIDAGEPGDLQRFAERSRLPTFLRGAYARLAGSGFAHGPAVGTIRLWLTDAGFRDVDSRRVDGLPFFVVTGRAG